tara:strand:+ start:226 stop:498 length:273 start_codon:yes stop_codon:yes gene_type:complete
MLYNTHDFEELSMIAGECRLWYPKRPEEAVDYFMEAYGYSHLISAIIVANAWSYLQAENILLTGELTEPLSSSRKWEPSDFEKIQKSLRN